MTLCDIPDCGRRSHARHLCDRHYLRLQRNGDPNAGASLRCRPGESLAWLLANYDAPASGPCVEWPFGTTSCGYGNVIVGGRWRVAHAYALELREGPPAPGMIACHNCTSRRCIIHTRWDTHAANTDDMMRARGYR